MELGGTQLSTFDVEYKSVKIPNSLHGGGGSRVLEPIFQLLMLSPNRLKSLYRGRGVGTQLSTLDTEFKFAKIPNYLYGGGGGVWDRISNF